MHIGIDATFLPRDHRGMGMVLRSFLKGFQSLNTDHKLTFLTSKPKLLSGIKEECGHLGECLNFKDAPKLDVCWYPWDRADIMLPCAKVLTMHDSLLWEEDSGRKKYRDWPSVSAQLDRVCAVSQFVKDRAVKTLGDPDNKITVCRNPVNPIYLNTKKVPELFTKEKKQEFLDKYTDSKPFILFVGSPAEKRKNLLGLLEAVQSLKSDFPHKILAVGSKPDFKIGFFKRLFPDEQTLYLKSLSEALAKTPDLVKFTGEVPLTELLAYCFCDIFASVSSHETFFIPLIEAMACQAVCISSEDACLKETGGDVPFYYSPNNPQKMAEALKHVLTAQKSDSGRQELKRRTDLGLERAQLFTSENHASAMLKIFTEACGHKAQA